MIEIIPSELGVKLMRQWGVPDWSDPGAQYVTWKNCCVFALVQQDGFVDIHMAMDKRRWRECRKAGAEMLEHIGHYRLRAVILPDRARVCNYAARMGFCRLKTEQLKTINGSLAPFFIMWREPGEFHGRSN